MENKKSPTRTFFILHRETILEAPPRFELGIKVLQTFALPLGYSADWSGLRGSNSLPPPWQGGALPDELNPQLLFYYSQRYVSCQDSFVNFHLSFFSVFCYNNLTV